MFDKHHAAALLFRHQSSIGFAETYSELQSAKTAGCEVEVLAVDNGSMTAQIFGYQAACRGKENFLYSLSEKNPAGTHALNVGLAMPKGDVIMIIDDDVSAGPELSRAS